MARRRVRARRRGAAALLVATALGGSSPDREARAEEPAAIELQVMVGHISDAAGPIDPRAQDLHNSLRQQFRYESLEVLQTARLRLAVDEVGSLDLPNGRALRVTPLDVDERGVLLAVSVEGTLESDLRVRNGRRVVIGGDAFRDGRLVISLQPEW